MMMATMNRPAILDKVSHYRIHRLPTELAPKTWKYSYYF